MLASRGQKRCYACNQDQDHFTAKCPLIVCSFCKEKGHIVEFCQRKIVKDIAVLQPVILQAKTSTPVEVLDLVKSEVDEDDIDDIKSEEEEIKSENDFKLEDLEDFDIKDEDLKEEDIEDDLLIDCIEDDLLKSEDIECEKDFQFPINPDLNQVVQIRQSLLNRRKSAIGMIKKMSTLENLQELSINMSNFYFFEDFLPIKDQKKSQKNLGNELYLWTLYLKTLNATLSLNNENWKNWFSTNRMRIIQLFEWFPKLKESSDELTNDLALTDKFSRLELQCTDQDQNFNSFNIDDIIFIKIRLHKKYRLVKGVKKVGIFTCGFPEELSFIPHSELFHVMPKNEVFVLVKVLKPLDFWFSDMCKCLRAIVPKVRSVDWKIRQMPRPLEVPLYDLECVQEDVHFKTIVNESNPEQMVVIKIRVVTPEQLEIQTKLKLVKMEYFHPHVLLKNEIMFIQSSNNQSFITIVINEQCKHLSSSDVLRHLKVERVKSIE